MNCDNVRSCCSPYSELAQRLEETNTRAVQAYNLAAQAFAAVIPPQGGRNIDVSLVAGPAYEVALKNPMDEDVVINADLTVNGDIYQNGSAYESHAEQLYTTKDTVIMRDGAVTGLGSDEVAGLIMKKYDGVNDGALVVSSDGTARVGDVGSEQPLMTRDESADMTDGAILEWDAANNKAVTSGKAVSDLVAGSGNIGSDTKPVKVVSGVAIEVTRPLADYTPLVAHVETTTLGDIIQCTGRLTYQRVGYKKGLLSGTIKISSNSDAGFIITNLTKIGNYFGLTFVIPSSDFRTGQWLSSNNRIDFSGYGPYVLIGSSGNIQLGRVYTASGAIGSWSLTDLSDTCIMFQNVDITEA